MDGLFTETRSAEYYAQKLQEGREYEQWVQHKWPLVYCERSLTIKVGRLEQLKGETEEGVEIKYDAIMFRSRRVYIETKEKTDINNQYYVNSGIYREDNTKIYLIGDYNRWFLFAKRYLVWLDKLDPPFLYRPEPTGTSIGFCIPFENAFRVCLDYQEF